MTAVAQGLPAVAQALAAGFYGLLAAAESASGLVAAEMSLAGLPWRADVHDSLLTGMLGARAPAGLAGGRPARLAEREGVGAAVLIRALEPLYGIELMQGRRGLERLESLCSGPGKLTQALGITLDHNGRDLTRGPVLISEPPSSSRTAPVSAGPRVGITKAAELPWRFCAAESRFLSRRAG